MIYSFFIYFFPSLVVFGSSLVWPTQCWQQQFRGFQRRNKGWWCPGDGEMQQQHCPTSAGWVWQPWTQLCPGIMDLVMKSWDFCSLGCELLAWLSPPQGGFGVKVPPITPCRTFMDFLALLALSFNFLPPFQQFIYWVLIFLKVTVTFCASLSTCTPCKVTFK